MSARIIVQNLTISAPVIGTVANTLRIDNGQFQAFPLQTLQVYVVSGVVATLSVALEVSLDGANWNSLAAPITNIAGGIIAPQIQYPFPFVRANITTLTGTAPVIGVIVGVGRFFQG